MMTLLSVSQKCSKLPPSTALRVQIILTLTSVVSDLSYCCLETVNSSLHTVWWHIIGYLCRAKSKFLIMWACFRVLRVIRAQKTQHMKHWNINKSVKHQIVWLQNMNLEDETISKWMHLYFKPGCYILQVLKKEHKPQLLQQSVGWVK